MQRLRASGFQLKNSTNRKYMLWIDSLLRKTCSPLALILKEQADTELKCSCGLDDGSGQNLKELCDIMDALIGTQCGEKTIGNGSCAWLVAPL